MDEYICKLINGRLKIKYKKGRSAKDSQCSFIYEKCFDVNKKNNEDKKEVYNFCSNPFFCENKSLFKFEPKINKCACGKILFDKKQQKCFNCELTEMANKKAEEEINKEWL